jgi:dipeptidyl aminopeptidase/acylaminoacyl peptidase
MAEREDVFAVARGGSRRRLTNDSAREREPDISPDERRIAYESSRGGRPGIWVMDADGGNPQALTPPSTTLSWTSPRWSPDGRTIAARQQPGNQVVLFDADRRASAPRAALPLPDASIELPQAIPPDFARLTWSSDGHELAARFGPVLAIYSVSRGTYRTTSVLGGMVGWPPGPILVLDQADERRLALLDTRTWRAREIPYAPHLEPDDRMVLSADGRTLAIEHGTYHSDIWLVRSAGRR